MRLLVMVFCSKYEKLNDKRWDKAPINWQYYKNNNVHMKTLKKTKIKFNNIVSKASKSWLKLSSPVLYWNSSEALQLRAVLACHSSDHAPPLLSLSLSLSLPPYIYLQIRGEQENARERKKSDGERDRSSRAWYGRKARESEAFE